MQQPRAEVPRSNDKRGERTSVLREVNADEGTRIGTTSSSPYLGSPTFDEAPFHIEMGKRPTLYTYVVIARDSERIAHYGRVVAGTEENPRAEPSRLQQNRVLQIGQRDPNPGDQAHHVTRVMTVEVLGEIHLGDDGGLTVTEPSLLPQTGKGVYELPAYRIPWILNLPENPSEGLNIGRIESGGKSVDFMVPMEALARHIAVVGKTGVGKSFAVGVLMEELARHEIPVISFDVLGDTINAAEDLQGRNLHAGRNFSVPYSVVGLSEFLRFVPNLTDSQTELVALAYERVYARAIDQLNRTGEVNTPLEALSTEIHQVADDFDQAAVGGRAVRRVAAAVGRTPLLSETTGPWLREIADRPMINVFVGHLGQNRRNMMVGATARMLQALRRHDRIPPFVFVLDEAHLFLPAGGETTPSTGVIREMVRTARHDGIGIIVITQSPSSMDRQVLLTANTRMVFALDRDDLRTVSGTMGSLNEQAISRIPKMSKGHAVISSGMDIMRHPASVQIRTERKTREGAPTPNLAKEATRWRNLRRS